MTGIIGERAAFVIPPWMPIEMTPRVVGHIRRRSEPRIPVQSGRRFAVGFGFPLGTVEHVENFYVYNPAQFSAGNVIPSRSRVGAAAILKTNLNDALVLLRR